MKLMLPFHAMPLQVHVWNRNAKVTEQLIKECPSLRPAGSVQQAIQESQVIVPMLSDAAAISEVLLQVCLFGYRRNHMASLQLPFQTCAKHREMCGV